MGSKQRLATYTNLDPGKYVFRVQGSNSDGVWNEEGVSLPILITPPWYGTNWFRALSAAVVLALLWAAYRFRMWQLQLDFRKLRDVIDTIPAMAWTARPDGSGAFVNRRWVEFTGLSAETRPVPVGRLQFTRKIVSAYLGEVARVPRYW